MQYELPGALSKEFLFKCLSVISYEQFIVSIVSQLCCHGYRYYHVVFITWESLGFSTISSSWKFNILHGLEDISISNVWKLWLVRCDVIFGETSLIFPKISENLWSKETPHWWLSDPTSKLNNSRTAWPISVIYISFSSILNALSYDINLFPHCSSPLGSVHTIHFLDPVIILALFQLIEMLIRLTNFFEFE